MDKWIKNYKIMQELDGAIMKLDIYDTDVD